MVDVVTFIELQGEYDGWLVKADPETKTLQWRDHWIVERMSEETKKQWEESLAGSYGFTWID